jgi:hypothetical protein
MMYGQGIKKDFTRQVGLARSLSVEQDVPRQERDGRRANLAAALRFLYRERNGNLNSCREDLRQSMAGNVAAWPQP